MKTLTVRLSNRLMAEIEAEARRRKLSRSDVVRERLSRAAGWHQRRASRLNSIADLIGSLDGLTVDLSARKKHYLEATGYSR